MILADGMGFDIIYQGRVVTALTLVSYFVGHAGTGGQLRKMALLRIVNLFYWIRFLMVGRTV